MNRSTQSPGDLERAVRAHNAGSLKEALELYNAILKRDPKNFAVLYRKGTLLGQLKRFSEAANSFRHAVKINPQSSDIHYNLGYCYYQLGRFDDALQCYQSALQIEPTFVEALTARGDALCDLRRFDEAIKSYDDSLAVSRHSAITLNSRGLACTNLGEFDSALLNYDEAIGVKPDFVAAHFNRGAALEQLGRSDEALKSYGRAIAIDPSFANAYYHRGLLQVKLGQFPQALTSFDTTILLEADYAYAYYFRGNVLNMLKRTDEAIASYDKAIALKPDFADAYFSRGEALRKSNKAEAIRSFRKAREYGANEESIDFMLSALGVGSVANTTPGVITKQLFDSYSINFEEHLVKRLSYNAPKSLADQFRRYCLLSGLEILDLGCGTGLCGDEFRSIAQSLVGVDLSPGMLAIAKKKNIYNQLVEQDIVDYVRAETRKFDLVIAADVFVYVGVLDECFRYIKEILRPNGWLSFSLESSVDDEVKLGGELRYKHSDTYIKRLAADNSFKVISSEFCAIRQEDKVDVDGRIVLLQSI